MTKKIFIILAIAIALFSIQKTYAVTEKDEINLEGEEKLETLIEVNEEEWKDLEIFKYSEDNGIIYKLGSNEGNTNITISDEIQDTAIITILANGYSKKDAQTLGVSNSNDAYIATKIALDCATKGIDKDNIENYFRVKENLESPLKERAENIIGAVKNLLGITKKDYFASGIEIQQTGNIELDEFNEEYCSQKYKITTNNCIPKKYNISNYSNFISEVFSTNNEGVRKDDFAMEEDSNIFRITMPKEYRTEAFEGKFQLELIYEKNTAYFGKNGDSTYIIFTDKEERRSFNVYLLNKKSSISITVKDKDKPRTVIENVKIKIKDENNLVNDTYTSNSRGSIFITKLGKGNVQMEVLEVPQSYVLEETLYNKNLDYSEYCEYTISLKYKKGSLHINNNAKGAMFEIYDKNSVYIGTYQTNEDGEIQIDEINIGEDYILKQISVPDGYKIVEDSKFSILYNETTTIDIVNEEIIKENQKEEDNEKGNGETDSDDDENSRLPSVDSGNGQVEDNDNEEKQEQEDKKETPNVGQEENKEYESEKQEELKEQDKIDKTKEDIENNETKEEENKEYEPEKQEEPKEQDKIDRIEEDIENNGAKEEENKEDKLDKPEESKEEIEKSDKTEENIEKNEEKDIQKENESNLENQNNVDSKENIDKNNTSNLTNDNIKTENVSPNKLPRTGYDFPEIKPWHIILIIFILLYILKRTAKSQSK